ncbi:MAG TPA: L,D-transpeptidase family protein, partial [Bryobacteraceae bacterium]|nr:L,D-transpeptidase family protein [Bryobacteraceae bacterium]
RDPRVELAALDPQDHGYRRTEAALARYRTLAHDDDGEMLPATKKPIEPESRYEGVARMARLLRLLGDLPVQAKIAAGDEYTGELVEAVKRFQARHGLIADGRIGKDTLAHLNTPLTQRVRQLELALERWRWMPRDFARPAIIVNIPEFKLRGISNGADLEMKVVVGGAVKHETPLLTSAMKEVIFRPYWNVPRSILTAELLPKIRDDRSYLGRNEYEVVTNASKVVTRDELDDETLDQLRAGKLQIRQAPGKKNALGTVKFLFPNEHNVYLHDTPSTAGFARSRRDLSHGCVRLERPELLAAWVLRQRPEWTTEKITEAMQGTAPVSVTLEREIPVMIIYTTAAAGDNGEVRFFGDVYSQDAALLLSIEKGAPYSGRKITTAARAQRPRG